MIDCEDEEEGEFGWGWMMNDETEKYDYGWWKIIGNCLKFYKCKDGSYFVSSSDQIALNDHET